MSFSSKNTMRIAQVVKWIVENETGLPIKATRYGDGPPREDDPPRRRHVIVLPRMLHLPKVEGTGGWS
ncbi:hypothetical protein HanRHA438_Chr09g0401691 [Helianthus annuus]|nr:hypothetical protein HanRHA438_Chr09g0401691 [Helianthus annuus]